MIQMIAVGGEPATGKTTLMKYVMTAFGEGKPFKFGKLRAIQFDDAKVFVFGIYDDGVFSGTDRLSMAVITDAKNFVEAVSKDPKWFGWTILHEGDRLFNKAFLDFSAKALHECHFFVLETSDAEKARRHIVRNDTQTETWLKGRVTKIKNICEGIPGVVKMDNGNELSQNHISATILQRIEDFRYRALSN